MVHTRFIFALATLLAACGTRTSYAEPPAGPTPPLATLTPRLGGKVTGLAPLTPEAVAACPVSGPNRADAEGIAENFNFANESDTLFTILWPGGAVLFTPHGPGAVHADGTLEMKWPWFRTVEGDVVITARRLDSPAPLPEAVVLRGEEDGYGEIGFHPGVIRLSGPGCWEVSAQVGGERLTFVTLAVLYDFDQPGFTWLPADDLQHVSVDIAGWPEAMVTTFADPDGGTLAIQAARTPQGALEEGLEQANHLEVEVGGETTRCVRGRTPGRLWSARTEDVRLEWEEGGIVYRIAASGLKLGCGDLVRMAESKV